MAKKKDSFDVTKTTKMLKALADSDRLRLVMQLRDGETHVGALADAIGAEIVNVSHHLGVLRQAGLVQDEKHGRFVVYSLHPKIFNQDSAKATFLEAAEIARRLGRSREFAQAVAGYGGWRRAVAGSVRGSPLVPARGWRRS